jgi:hypothetical protein
MSRAFVNRRPAGSPVSTHPNLVTTEGLSAIERTLSRFEAANKAAVAKFDRTAMATTQRVLRYWIARRSTAVLGGIVGETVEIPAGAATITEIK